MTRPFMRNRRWLRGLARASIAHVICSGPSQSQRILALLQRGGRWVAGAAVLRP